MTVDIEQITRLQSLDLKLGALEKEVAELPKHIAKIEKALDGHIRRLDADRAALAANGKDRKRLEDDIKVHELKIAKLRDQTQQAKTNEQFKAFQSEVEYAQKEIRKCEDRIVDLMAQSEPLDAAVKKAEAALKQEKIQVDAEKAQAIERTSADRIALEQIQAERAAIVAKVNPPVLKRYDYIRRRVKNGVAVAELANGRCSACMIALRPQFVQDLRKGGELMLCETCGRILTYNPPVSFERDLVTAQK
jgi:predicted  nucleic acid-binding Zn-ribbon protein